MAIQIKHAFVSLKGDGTDATQVQPSNWNAAHSMTINSGNLVGRLSTGNGAVEEIPISSYFASFMNAPDAATLAGLMGLFETGDVKYTFKTVAAAGWLLVNAGGTIGNASSGASLRANADTWPLFNLIYNACSDTIAPMPGGRSGNALADFNSNHMLTIPQLVGRSPLAAGAAAGVTSARTLGMQYGEENHTLTVPEMPVHYHTASIYDPGHVHAVSGPPNFWYSGGGANIGGSPNTSFLNYGAALQVNSAITNVRVNSSNGLDTTYSTGGNGGHNNFHPVIALNCMVKL